MPAHSGEGLVLKLKDCRTTLYVGVGTLMIPDLVFTEAAQRQTHPNSLLYLVHNRRLSGHNHELYS